MANENVVIIKRSKKGGHAAHHGGAWKVAYADFVTAMMAFFLLLWLLNATTEAQKAGIADYFSPTSLSMSSGGAGGMLGGQSISSPGALTSRTAVPSVSLELKPTSGATAGDAEEEGGANDKDKSAEQAMAEAEAEAALQKMRQQQIETENAQFEETEKEIRLAIEKNPDLKGLEEHLLIDQTPEGLRIQVIDREGKPMYASGSTTMLPRTQKLVAQIALAIKTLPNKVKVAGHTDSTPFKSKKKGYSNWELSGERAQESRRVLVEGGLDSDRVVAVEGRAARDPLLPDDTTSPRNRRIMLLRQPPPKNAKAPAPDASGAPSTGGKPGTDARKPALPTNLNKDWTGPRVR